ncbi:L-amino acid N-acyltransferase YncA [Monaibacterium marinum]|uniref:L-amino acid N-acyltransferase YncA n=2 Tax=Pontivivens marinum TaxID=1690039 RepID=A0A2C9CWD5_9RHOB|nr:L-amino acid N-acyltransferase YncA [Monaibacterium marinum]
MRADRALQHMLLAYPEDQPDEVEVERWLTRREQHGELRVLTDARDVCVGFAQLHNIHMRGGHAMMAIALTPAMRGQGLGHKAMRLIHDLASAMELRKLMLEVRADNAPAIALYLSTGYRAVGTLVAHYDDGDMLHDVIVMERMLP